MKKLFTLFIVFCASVTYSQQYTLPTRLVDQYVSDGSKDIFIETTIDKDNFYEFTLKYKEASESFKLKPLTFPNFEAKFKDALVTVVKTNNVLVEGAASLAKEKIQNDIAYVFTQLVTYYNTQEQQPEVATIYLKENIPVYYDRENPSIGTLSNVTVEISFYGGFIEKMQVNGTFNNMPVSFNNKYSIGISSTKNISQLSDNVLYSIDKFDLSRMATLAKATLEPQNIESNKSKLLISVDDVIRYVKKVDVNANDVSPVPQLVILDKNQRQSKLYREESSKLFEAVVYTDFLGVFDEANPNGIIQTEINKQFNITSRRFDVFPAFIEAIGFFNYFTAQFQFSKIEQNNKFLLPNTYDVLDNSGSVIETIDYYSPLSMYQYRNYAIGGNLNIFFLENQNAKINTTLDAGFLFGRSGIKETVNQVEGSFLNNLEIPIELKFLILPEKRFSFYLADKLSWFETFDSTANLQSIENDVLVSKNRWLNTLNVGMNLDVSTNGKLFLRYKLIHELDNINTNFSQLQFGYSFYLLQKNGARKSN